MIHFLVNIVIHREAQRIDNAEIYDFNHKSEAQRIDDAEIYYFNHKSEAQRIDNAEIYD